MCHSDNNEASPDVFGNAAQAIHDVAHNGVLLENLGREELIKDYKGNTTGYDFTYKCNAVIEGYAAIVVTYGNITVSKELMANDWWHCGPVQSIVAEIDLQSPRRRRVRK